MAAKALLAELKDLLRGEPQAATGVDLTSAVLVINALQQSRR